MSSYDSRYPPRRAASSCAISSSLSSCKSVASARCRIFHNFCASNVFGIKSDSGGWESDSYLSSSTNSKTFCCFSGVSFRHCSSSSSSLPISTSLLDDILIYFCTQIVLLKSCTNPDNPPGVQTPGSQLKSSKDDWVRV